MEIQLLFEQESINMSQTHLSKYERYLVQARNIRQSKQAGNAAESLERSRERHMCVKLRTMALERPHLAHSWSAAPCIWQHFGSAAARGGCRRRLWPKSLCAHNIVAPIKLASILSPSTTSVGVGDGPELKAIDY